MSRSPSPDSDSTIEEMPGKVVIPISQVKTLAQLYPSSVLAPASGAKYPAKAELLKKVSLWQGDITRLEVDSIVNAANKSLLGGGGVDGAIHAAAGKELLAECRTLNGCETGNSKITKGYSLPSKHIIHTVGPIYSSSDLAVRAAQLASCYKTSLQVAVENELKHVAFPSVSTGIYGYPVGDATHIALDVVRRFFDDPSTVGTGAVSDNIERVIFVVWSDKDKGVYERLIPEYFPFEEQGTAEAVPEFTPAAVEIPSDKQLQSQPTMQDLTAEVAKEVESKE